MHKGKIVNRKDLAAVFGVSVATVDKWAAAGCPAVWRPRSKGEEWRFDCAAVIAWREQVGRAGTGSGSDDEATLKLRKLAAETKAAELKLAVESGKVASLAAVEAVWSRILAELQTNLRGNLVTRLASQLLGETDKRVFKRVALAEVDSILTVLSEMDLEEPEGGADISPMERESPAIDNTHTP